MPFKDPEKQKEYQRQWQRAKKAGEPTKTLTRTLNLSLEDIRTASVLLSVLAGQIKAVLETNQGDVFIRARTAGYLISIGLKAVEVADLESRLTGLENKVFGGKS